MKTRLWTSRFKDALAVLEVNGRQQGPDRIIRWIVGGAFSLIPISAGLLLSAATGLPYIGFSPATLLTALWVVLLYHMGKKPFEVFAWTEWQEEVDKAIKLPLAILGSIELSTLFVTFSVVLAAIQLLF
ncbi:hypothetical protein A2716_01795 [candidate division WWE3 bacterium RIFCSPHIGHO2_01_FULL_40_23]|uniref:Uncharacterized protein n=1 Tax=candidate division WWE3 bacterium RIFCSPLOWO2_01_FULL_41_18 TaxID=1802625 RepID=A0A1F4VG89_UNCKA|nr:MAG: hypothetical protein A2716_01795 [candidate division WWE3 bacterium RIFCSPHIGHO2_01_FULL_40_23]OGC55723.1 MAG: hypothetical protein A3A78_01645 [candidate division WWE3 bacterium RIFCSPLOWO2_01_FULL_41_18]